MKKNIFILGFLVITLSSCVFSEKENTIKKVIVDNCSFIMKTTPFEKKNGVKKIINCKNLKLELKIDKRLNSSWGCTTSNHLCEEVYYNYELTFKEKKYKKIIPYHLVIQALDEVSENTKHEINFFNE